MSLTHVILQCKKTPMPSFFVYFFYFHDTFLIFPLAFYLQEDWIRIDEEQNFHQLKQTDQQIDMGVVCSQNFLRVGKHSVAPTESIHTEVSTKSSAKPSTITHGFTTSTPVIQSKQVLQSSSIPRHTPNNSLPILVVKPTTPTLSAATASSTTSIALSPIYKTPSTSTFNTGGQSKSDNKHQWFKPLPPISSSIDENSILCRANDIRNSKLFKRSLSVDSSDSPKLEVKNKSNQIHKLFKSNQNLLSDSSASAGVATADSKHSREHNNNFTKLYRRFGGSVQTLLSPSNGNASKKPNFSVSETNLSTLKIESSKDERKRLSTTTVTGIPHINEYCPSVLFNRISNRRRSSGDKEPTDKNLTFAKWKNYFIPNMLRKRKDLNARKT